MRVGDLVCCIISASSPKGRGPYQALHKTIDSWSIPHVVAGIGGRGLKVIRRSDPCNQLPKVGGFAPNRELGGRALNEFEVDGHAGLVWSGQLEPVPTKGQPIVEPLHSTARERRVPMKRRKELDALKERRKKLTTRMLNGEPFIFGDIAACRRDHVDGWQGDPDHFVDRMI